MLIKFPKEECYLSIESAYEDYKSIADYHLDLLKLQAKCGFFYWKMLGFFLLTCILFFVFAISGLIVSPFLAIIKNGLLDLF